jgi:maltodextrin utilization protein YvdJ
MSRTRVAFDQCYEINWQQTRVNLIFLFGCHIKPVAITFCHLKTI